MAFLRTKLFFEFIYLGKRNQVVVGACNVGMELLQLDCVPDVLLDVFANGLQMCAGSVDRALELIQFSSLLIVKVLGPVLFFELFAQFVQPGFFGAEGF